MTEPVGPDVAALWYGLLGGDGHWRVALEPGHDPAPGEVELGPPGIVVVAQIKDIGGAGRARRQLLAIRGAQNHTYLLCHG